MNSKLRPLFLKTALIAFAVLFGCVASTWFASQSINIVRATNFTLEAGEHVPNTLLLLSQNATLANGSAVDGSVIMLCCNLTVDGQVNGDVYLLTGNLTIADHAEVGGKVDMLSGNLRQPGKFIEK